MRLTTVILLASLIQVSAATFGQRITLTQRNVPLISVLKEIRSQSGFNIFFENETISSNQKVSIDVKDATVSQALEAAFKGLSLTFEIDGKAIAIKKKEENSVFETLAARFQAVDIKGKVVDSLGNGLAGATVSVKNGKGSTSTDAGGNFVLRGVDEGVTLVINYLGFVTKEVVADKEYTFIRLQQSESKLDEVQIQAYGVTSKRLNTGNISSVKAEDIAKQPINNPLLALSGRVPGLEITQGSGLAGSGVRVRIQGTNTITSSNEPFYVVDGVPFQSSLLGSLRDNTINDIPAFGNPLSYINPLDIESIEVLKDAAATSIYGSRAQNGAILVTTKKGKAGESKIDVNLQSGIGQVANRMDLLNTQQYINLRKEAFANSGIDFVKTFPAGNSAFTNLVAFDIFTDGSDRYTDWQDVLIGNTAKYTDAQVAFSGGVDRIQYRASGTYHKETTVFPGERADQKGSVQFALNSTSTKRFRFQVSGSYLLDDNDLPGTDLTSKAMTLRPNAPSLYNEDGSINWGPVFIPELNRIQYTFNDNPLADYNRKYSNKTSNLIGNASINYLLLDGLNLKGIFGYNQLSTKEVSTTPSSTASPAFGSFLRRAGYGDNSTNTWLIEPQLTYVKTFAQSKIDVLLGGTVQKTISERYAYNGEGYNNDLILENPMAAEKLTVSQTLLSTYRYNAVFARINYSLKDRYIFETSVRRDGSSRFGSSNRFHNFGSLSGAWIFSEENFIKDKLSMLSFGKLRGSYGTTGNDQIGDYRYLSLFNPTAVKYDDGNGSYPVELANPFIEWEETRKVSLGVDLGLFRDRILINTTYFRNRSSNQLLAYNLPPSVGFSSVISNFPALVQNSGLELALYSENITNGSFKWSTSFNMTLPKNSLVDFPGLAESSYANDLVIGDPISLSKKMYKFSGINGQTGYYEFIAKDGTIVNDPGASGGNDYIRKNIAPDFYGGFQNSLSFGGFSLDFFLQFVKQSGPNYFGGQPKAIGSTFENRPVSVEQRWRSAGSNSPIGQVMWNGNNILPTVAFFLSDANWKDASFVRLKNASFSWKVPNNILSKAGIKQARIYIQGQNLLTFTNYLGLDPESKSSISLPPLRVMTLGTQITF